MYLILDASTDPAWNLAAEEYLLTQRKEPFVRLWRNADSIIIGRHQNAWAEINLDLVTQHAVPVVRRLTGGGAVFHDLGNVNYSFFDLADRKFTDVILDALHAMGIEGRCSGRNDLTLQDGRKFSGTAICKHKGRVLEHGTLLFNASFDRLSSMLKPRPEKFSGKAVQSVRSRVVNLSEVMPTPMTVEDFIAALERHIAAVLPCTPYLYSEDDRQAIARLREARYARADWNYGASPACAVTHVLKFPSGLLEAHFNLEEGCIRGLRIYGDYFFTRPTEDFCALLEGCPYDPKAIAGRLQGVPTGEYFSGLAPTDVLSLLICNDVPSLTRGDLSA